jgi:hypothetical protein
MPANELLCQIVGIKPSQLSKEENIVIEAELFTRICEKLKEFFNNQHIDYLRLVKFDRDLEIAMLEDNFARCIINDILSTEEYTLSGIACYTATPEEIIFEIASGQNRSPSINFFRRIVELHRAVRSELYKSIMEKIIYEYSANL